MGEEENEEELDIIRFLADVFLIDVCTSCAVNKSSTQAPAEFLYSMPSLDRFVELAMDFVILLPKSGGYDGILVMMDRLVNYVKIEPIHITATILDIAKILYNS